MAESRRRRSVAQAQLVDLLTSQLGADLPVGAALEVVDVGGGTGGLARVLADLGHVVTVVDPSPDALASLERRTAEAGLAERIKGVQGDAADLVEILGAASADVVVCHRTLEVVDVPAQALAAMAEVLRPGGALSLLVAQRNAAVLGHALAGQVGQARTILADPAWFDHDQVLALVRTAGFTGAVSHGIGAVAGLVAESLVESDPAVRSELRALEDDVAQEPAFRAIAPLVHVFARRA